MFREKWYEWKNWREMVHTTWNPKDPGAVRIHLIPPKFQLFRFVPSVAILNGNQIIPVNESWAILLTEFIRPQMYSSDNSIHLGTERCRRKRWKRFWKIHAGM